MSSRIAQTVRRSLRFSLRSFLVVMTIVCAVLHNTMLLNSVAHPCSQRSLNGITSLSLNAANMSNDDLRHIAQMRSLEEIGLEAVPIDGEALAHLAKMPRLKGLSLWMTRLSDDTLDGLLKIKRLESVSVGETFVTPQGAERVRRALPDCKVYY